MDNNTSNKLIKKGSEAASPQINVELLPSNIEEVKIHFINYSNRKFENLSNLVELGSFCPSWMLIQD